MMTKLFVTLSLLAFPLLAFAQEEHAGTHEAAHEAGLPLVVYLQGVNFLLYAGLIVYFARKPIREFFAGRGEKFNAAINKAAQAKAEAEARKAEANQKIVELERSSQSELARAKSEAAALHAQLLKDAEAISTNLKTEATRTASFEIERAKNELRESLLQQSVAFSAKLLKEKVSEGDQKRLQTEFVDKIGANR